MSLTLLVEVELTRILTLGGSLACRDCVTCQRGTTRPGGDRRRGPVRA